MAIKSKRGAWRRRNAIIRHADAIRTDDLELQDIEEGAGR